MRVEDLTDDDYEVLEKHFGLSMRDWLKGNTLLSAKWVEEAFALPFKQIPLVMSDTSFTETAVYKFRLERGV